MKNIKDIVNDITELKLALSMLRESELKYRALFDNANDAILLMEKGVFIDCNRKFLTMFGCFREQVIGQTTYRFSGNTRHHAHPNAKIRDNIRALPGITAYTPD